MKYKVQVLAVTLSVFSFSSFAQKDTTKKTTSIDITSSYKPVLRNAVKINFSATHLVADSSRPSLKYNIPAQNLFYAYQPIPLKPLALQMDTNLYLGMRNFVKIGYGNFSTPYINAGFSFGDGKQFLAGVNAEYIASKGNTQYQDYSRLHIGGDGSFFTPKNEVYVGADVNLSDNFLYGYDHKIYNYSKKDVRQQFQDIAIKAGVRNTVAGAYNINYNPSLEITSFNNTDKVSETGMVLNIPIEKQFGEAFAFRVNGKADMTNYTTKNLPTNLKIKNNLFVVSPSFNLSSPRFSINAGVNPTWNNGNFFWLPNVYAEAKLKEHVFLIQAGWIGQYVKNSYRNLVGINPYLATVTSQLNTKETEIYGGIKATVGKHFNFNAKAGLVTYTDLPFFINDTATDGKSFRISNEAGVNNFRIHGDLAYINQDKFTVNAGLTLNGFTGMKSNARAWHTLPMELTSSLRWWAFKHVLIKADLYAFGGGHYLEKGNLSRKFNSGTDLSAGIEFKVSKMFSAWFDANNLLNSKYERWHNYEVYGLNLLGGIRVDF